MNSSASRSYPKRVLIDLDRLREATSGLGHVALSFGERLARRAHSIQDMKFTFLVPKKDVGRFGHTVEYISESRWLKMFPCLHAKYDLWYCPHQDVAYPPASAARFILTINDLNFLREKSAARCRMRLRRIQKYIDRACAITVISENTASEVRENLEVNGIPLHVLMAGLELKIFSDAVQPAFVPTRPYLLTVGVHKHTKNYRVLIEFIERLPEYDLVMLGKDKTPAGLELQARLLKSSARERVHLLGICSEEDKYWFYKNCSAVLFPSISEGMGYPPLEAMQARRPVFVFKESAVPEICGPHALYWSSQEPETMAHELRKGLAHYNAHSDMAELAYAHGMNFGWDPVVDKYLELFREHLK